MAHTARDHWLIVVRAEGRWPRRQVFLFGRRRHHYEVGLALIGAGMAVLAHDWADAMDAARRRLAQ